MDPEFLRALELVAEYDRQRPKPVKEFRLYYNDDGSLIGLWETDHPEGEYIVLDDLTVFNTVNTSRLCVKDGKLTVIDPEEPKTARLVRSTQGQRVVSGHAALVLDNNEEYKDIEYYERIN